MGTPSDNTSTTRQQAAIEAYEDYVLRGEIRTPKQPRGYDAELASLQQAHELFCEGADKFRGYKLLFDVIPGGNLYFNALVGDKFGRLDVQVAEVIRRDYFGLFYEGEREFTRVSLMLARNGTWVCFLAGTMQQLYFASNARELKTLLEEIQAQGGVLRHADPRGGIVDLARVNWHLVSAMRESLRAKRRDLDADENRLKTLRASRERMNLSFI